MEVLSAVHPTNDLRHTEEMRLAYEISCKKLTLSESETALRAWDN